MNEPKSTSQPLLKSEKDQPQQTSGSDAPAGSSQDTNAAAAKILTEEEQMALYEKELKENDWGHQPC